jgi:hypothetical protein
MSTIVKTAEPEVEFSAQDALTNLEVRLIGCWAISGARVKTFRKQ